MNDSLSWIKAVAYPMLLLALLTPWSAQLDLAVTKWFYHEGHSDSSPYLTWIFNYGIFPAWVVAGMAIIGWIASYFSPAYLPLRRACLFLILVLSIGSGLIIHALLKDHWGRPRPRQVVEFGGQQSFRAYYEPQFLHQPEPSKSFPCGHCSMGFYFFTFILLGKHYKLRRLSQLGWLLVIGLGGALSFARLAQGGHFLSDVAVSALIMWLTAFGFYQLLLKSQIAAKI